MCGLDRPALADETIVGPKYGWVEVWAGADTMRDVWLLYSGVTLAPWSEHVYDPGFRLRSQGGYGSYDYTLERNGAAEIHKGTVSYGDALIGYHWRFGELTAKTFAGVSLISRQGRASAEHSGVFTTEWGPKAVLELWLNLGDSAFTSLNLSYTTAHDVASARWRTGYRFMPNLSAGPELRFDTSDFKPQGSEGFFDKGLSRAGGFVTYRFDDIEVSVAGGVAANLTGGTLENATPYATVNILYQY